MNYFLALILSALGASAAVLYPINVGTTANDGTGDALRTAFTKVNSNFVNVAITQVINFAHTNGLANGLPITAADGTFLKFQGAVTSTEATNQSFVTNGLWIVDGRLGVKATYASITSAVPVRHIFVEHAYTNVNSLGDQYSGLTPTTAAKPPAWRDTFSAARRKSSSPSRP